MAKVQIGYCAIPSRLRLVAERASTWVIELGQAPFNPFRAFPSDQFEDGPIGREETMRICVRAVEFCDTFHLFGISEGTVMYELKRALELKKPIHIHVKDFDFPWDFYLKKLKESHLSGNEEVFAYLEKQLGC